MGGLHPSMLMSAAAAVMLAMYEAVCLLPAAVYENQWTVPKAFISFLWLLCTEAGTPRPLPALSQVVASLANAPFLTY
eukprot:scaffold25996_cov20-Tisochrysis_lutea.AAC.1